MARYKVVTGEVTGPFSDLGGADYVMERHALDPIDAEIVVVDASDRGQFLAAARDADAILGRGVQLDAELIAGLERCKIIAGNGVGFDYVDAVAARRAGIVVTNVPDVFIEEVADHVMTLLLACWRQLIAQDRIVREGRWADGRLELSELPRLQGQTVGFISFGNIPRLVAKRAHAFGLRLLAYDPYIHEHHMRQHDVEAVTSLEELLSRSDYVSMHAPLNADTHHLLSDAEFSAMKPTSTFLNTGRGPTVDEQALIRALSERRIAAAGLDVFEVEPLATDSALLGFDNVIVTAHVASASTRMMPEARRRAGREIAAALLGRPPLSPVN